MPMTVAVVGPGVDGELSARDVREQLRSDGATWAGRITPHDVDTVRRLLSWHPTEATAIAAAAALGVRGAVDMRRGLDPVPMEASSADVWRVDSPLPHAFPIARALMPTISLADAEHVVRRVAVNELDYERARAGQRNARRPTTLAAFAERSRSAGATYATTRRIIEATGTDPAGFPGARVDGLGLWALDRLAPMT